MVPETPTTLKINNYGSWNYNRTLVGMDAYEGRVTFLNNRDVGSGPYVLYWMQHSQRVRYNHALEFAIAQANELRKSLVVVFGITEHYPHANERNYAFMLEGLRETAETIKEKIEVEYELAEGKLIFSQDQREAYTTLGGSPEIDHEYTVFGEMLEGFDVIDKIAALKTDNNNRPLTDVVITVKRIK